MPEGLKIFLVVLLVLVTAMGALVWHERHRIKSMAKGTGKTALRMAPLLLL